MKTLDYINGIWLICLLLQERQPGPLQTLRVGVLLGHRGIYKV